MNKKKETCMQVQNTMQVIDATIRNCEKMQPKFEVGTSQHTLLKNRIFALQVVKQLLCEKSSAYTKEEMKKALPPIMSILHKTSKARSKHEEGTSTHTRLTLIIEAMEIARDMLEKKLST